MKVHVKLIATYREHLPPGTQGNITEVDVRARDHGDANFDALSAFPWMIAVSLWSTA